MASRIDKLKERLTYFVKENKTKLEQNNTSLTIPSRIVQGFKLDIVAVVIQDLLRDKYNTELEYIGYEQKEDNFIYNYRQQLQTITDSCRQLQN